MISLNAYTYFVSNAVRLWLFGVSIALAVLLAFVSGNGGEGAFLIERSCFELDSIIDDDPLTSFCLAGTDDEVTDDEVCDTVTVGVGS